MMGVVRQLLDLVLLSEDDDDPPPLTMSSRSSSEDEEFSSEDDDRPPPLIRLRTTRLQFLAPYHAYNRPDNCQPASQPANEQASDYQPVFLPEISPSYPWNEGSTERVRGSTICEVEDID